MLEVMMVTVTLKVTYRNRRLHHSECFYVPGDIRPFWHLGEQSHAATNYRNPQIIPRIVFIASILQ